MLSTFELEGNGKQVTGEIKDTEIFWKTRYIPTQKQTKRMRVRQSQNEKSDLRNSVVWFGNITNLRTIDRSRINQCCSLIVNTEEIICCDKAEIQKLHNELFNAIALWYDKYSEVVINKPSFLLKK
jgi:hypothetical protein